jgi:hypothetical protein
MISAEDAMNRALAAIARSVVTPEYHKAAASVNVGCVSMSPAHRRKRITEFRNAILSIAAEAIRAEFAAGNHWQVVEIEPEKFAIQHATTGEFYKAKTRGNGRRLVTFRFIERAKLVAHIRNAG